MFKIILEARKKYTNVQINRLEAGLNKIGNAKEQVATLQESIVEKKPELERQEKEMGIMAENIKKDTEEAEKVRQVVAIQEEQAQHTANEAKVLREESTAELAKAEPELQSALKALRELDPRDVAQVKQ